jgi:hypothetical protein
LSAAALANRRSDSEHRWAKRPEGTLRILRTRREMRFLRKAAQSLLLPPPLLAAHSTPGGDQLPLMKAMRPASHYFPMDAGTTDIEAPSSNTMGVA